MAFVTQFSKIMLSNKLNIIVIVLTNIVRAYARWRACACAQKLSLEYKSFIEAIKRFYMCLDNLMRTVLWGEVGTFA